MNSTYLQNCTEDVKEILSDISIPCRWSGSNYNITCKWFLMSGEEIGAETGYGEGVFWDYWKQQTGLTSPSEGDNAGRIGRRTDNQPYSWWTRTCANSLGTTVAYYITNTGSFISYPADSYNQCGRAACFVSKN